MIDRVLRRSDREEAAQSLSAWLGGAVVRDRGLQSRLLVLPELGHLEEPRSGAPERQAAPDTIARAAERLGCASVAYTYNDPVIFMEYALDAAAACRARGVKNVAVTAGFICAEPRKRLFAGMDAANVDLKGFTERFYAKRCAGSLAPVLDTLKYLVHETNVWTEITTLLIPGDNDFDEELDALTHWVATRVADRMFLCTSPRFIPTIACWRQSPRRPRPCKRRAPSPSATGFTTSMSATSTIRRAQATLCPTCGARAIARDGYTITTYALDAAGACSSCGTRMAAVFAAQPGAWGARRLSVDIERYAAWEGRSPTQRARSCGSAFCS